MSAIPKTIATKPAASPSTIPLPVDLGDAIEPGEGPKYAWLGMSSSGPYNVDAERQVLSACFQDNSCIDRVKRIVSPASFYQANHAILFRMVLEIHEKGEPVDNVTLGEAIARYRDRTTSPETDVTEDYIHEIAGAAVGSINVENHAGIILEWSKRRKLIAIAADVAERAYKNEMPAEDLAREAFEGFAGSPGGAFPEFNSAPRKIVAALKPVRKFDTKLLPSSLVPWVEDVANRMQCPVEFLAVGAVISLSAAVGRKIGIRPKRLDRQWRVVPNLWGGCVARPGTMKSPALKEMLGPLSTLDRESREDHELALEEYRLDKMVSEAEKVAAEKNLKKHAGKLSREELKERMRAALKDEAQEPILRRRIVHDSTVEKLGELMKDNPSGLLMYRDELPGLFASFEKSGREEDRSFYLDAWDGNLAKSVDRIGRGTFHIPATCLSLIGGIQPGPLAAFIREAASGVGDDGFVNRLQLLVYPDTAETFKSVDAEVDHVSKGRATQIFRALDQLDPLAIGAELDGADKVPCLGFSQEAQALFTRWWERNVNRARAEESLALGSHLDKFSKLVPALALLFHLSDVCDPQRREDMPSQVGVTPLEKAIAWAAFLEEHARRIYDLAEEADITPAKHLLSKLGPAIKEKRLKDGFTAKEIADKGWSNLKRSEEVDRALTILADHGWVRGVGSPKTSQGGRSTTRYYLHPDAMGEGSN
jgi:putative DNA primase/helicase